MGIAVDQVVDVFYVVDENGRKLETHERLHGLYETLMHELRELQNDLESA